MRARKLRLFVPLLVRVRRGERHARPQKRLHQAAHARGADIERKAGKDKRRREPPRAQLVRQRAHEPVSLVEAEHDVALVREVAIVLLALAWGAALGICSPRWLDGEGEEAAVGYGWLVVVNGCAGPALCGAEGASARVLVLLVVLLSG